MEPKNEIGLWINIVSHMQRHTVNKKAFNGVNTPLMGIQGRIIGFLYENRDKEIFQRDIQEHFSIRRSSATGTLQLMERDGYITREPVLRDARLKKLVLTPKALEMHEHIMAGIKFTEETISSTLTPEEKDTFIALCKKISAGLKEIQSQSQS